MSPWGDRTWAEHVDFCKRRALDYLERGIAPGEALGSLQSDVLKHPQAPGMSELMRALGVREIGDFVALKRLDAAQMRERIEGFALEGRPVRTAIEICVACERALTSEGVCLGCGAEYFP